MSSYWFRVHSAKDCSAKTIFGSAIVMYKGSKDDKPVESKDNLEINVAMTTNLVDKCENPDKLCATEVQSLRKTPYHLSQENVDVKIYLPINYQLQSAEGFGKFVFRNDELIN